MPLDPDLDREIRRLDRRDDSLGERITKIEELAVAYQLQELRGDVQDLKQAIERQREDDQKERKDVRVAIYALVGVIVAALISGGAAVVAAGLGG